MTHTPTTRRPGISLMEAMIAIGVMAIGLLSLLTLFPLGAVQIGQALKDDRCSEAALQADAYMRSYWEHAVAGGNPVGGESDSNTAQGTGSGDATQDPFVDPDGTGSAYVAALSSEPSYPVFVDPIGYYTYTTPTPYQTRIARENTGIPRVKLAGITGGPQAVRVCSLTDDLTYGTDGAATLSGGQLVRQGRYTWAAMLQKPDVAADEADIKVLVFDRRIPLLNDTNNEILLTVTPTQVNPGVTSSLTITGLPTSEVPLIRRGGWIMDGTVQAATTGGIRHANFYRITAVESPAPGTFVVDLETPIVRNDGNTGTGTEYTATFYLLAGLAEVFDRPPLSD